ncbi:YciI family protein [Humibacter albus]|uniref:YciI family protein n=1 Tax=Humibacter albus TaxID=427754 RepID=UPI0003B3DBBC|nr:YciI family protein [Humibacter albus]
MTVLPFVDEVSGFDVSPTFTFEEIEMGKYMLLIHGDREAWEETPADERRRIEEGHRGFVAAAGTRILEGRELEAASTATTVRSRRDGASDVTDGPFLETKEVVGGYYVIEAADLDEAIGLASLLPETAAPYTAGVEIRPVVEPV